MTTLSGNFWPIELIEAQMAARRRQPAPSHQSAVFVLRQLAIIRKAHKSEASLRSQAKTLRERTTHADPGDGFPADEYRMLLDRADHHLALQEDATMALIKAIDVTKVP